MFLPVGLGVQKAPGTFLIRGPAANTQDYVLSMTDGTLCKHYQIVGMNGKSGTFNEDSMGMLGEDGLVWGFGRGCSGAGGLQAWCMPCTSRRNMP